MDSKNFTNNILENAKKAPFGWKTIFTDALPEIEHISEIIEERERQGVEFLPLKKDVFNAFRYVQANNVKCVIVGQDPYPQKVDLFINGEEVTLPRSVGMSFSVRRGDAVPASLKNIYKELEASVEGFEKPDHGDLTHWAAQGVLLLNKILTIEYNPDYSNKRKNKYGEAWLGFVKKIIDGICKINPQCIWVLWGNDAKEIEQYLPQTCKVLTSAHPSPLASKGSFAKDGFLGCNHFNLINQELQKQGKTEINWNLPT